MKQFRAGDFVKIPLKTRDEIGLVVEIDDCDGEYIHNPWVIINTPKGSSHATASNHTSRGVQILPLRRINMLKTASSNYNLVDDRISSTYESDRDFLPEHYSSEGLETVITNFFSKLSANQEPLGSEFEQVLFEDLWDLYQS
jgi:hypothetical protein